MTRDYAKRNYSRKKGKKKTSRFVVWFVTLILFIGFTMGLVYVGKHAPNYHHVKTFEKKVIIPAAKTQAKREKEIKEIAAPMQPKFDFYTILEQKKQANLTAEYELEVAIVKDYVAADHLKAELTLLGYMVSVTPKRLGGAQKYLVSVGPYDNKDGAIADKIKLQQNKISSKLVLIGGKSVSKK